MLTELESTFLHSGFMTISSDYILDLDRNPYSSTMIISDASGSFVWSHSQNLDGYYLETDKQGDYEQTYTFFAHSASIIVRASRSGFSLYPVFMEFRRYRY